MKKARFLWLGLAITGCVGHADGAAPSEDVGVEIAEATELLLQGEQPDDVARAYPSLRISSNTRPVQPDPSDDGSGVSPKPPKGIGPISTPVEPQPETTPNPIKPVRPGGDPVRPEPELEGPNLPTSPVDPTMDPIEPEPETEGPIITEPGDDAISMTCRQVCHNETHTECTTVVQDPILGTGAKARVCTKVVDTVCTHVCEDDPPNA